MLIKKMFFCLPSVIYDQGDILLVAAFVPTEAQQHMIQSYMCRDGTTAQQHATTSQQQPKLTNESTFLIPADQSQLTWCLTVEPYSTSQQQSRQSGSAG